jgi:hypothetical protein
VLAFGSKGRLKSPGNVLTALATLGHLSINTRGLFSSLPLTPRTSMRQGHAARMICNPNGFIISIQT